MGNCKCQHADRQGNCLVGALKCGGMTNGLRLRLIGGSDILPSCMDYKKLLNIVEHRFNIPREKLWELYGNKTYAQWRVILGV